MKKALWALLSFSACAYDGLHASLDEPERGTLESPIVNGVATQAYASVGALLKGSNGAGSAAMQCTGTLIGCNTFLTAAHCVEADMTPGHYFVYLQNAGVFAVQSIARHPSYSFPISDVAVLKLTSPVHGIQPSAINQQDPTPLIPSAGTIVGFGQTAGSANDYGIKRSGAVVTRSCPASTGGTNAELVCWQYDATVGAPGTDSNTCNGDSGGPLFMNLGAGTVVAGITSGGTSSNCLATDDSYDASVYANRAFILAQLGTDSTSVCGGLSNVGDSGSTVVNNAGSLSSSHTSDVFTVSVPANVTDLRFALNGKYDGTFDPDLYVKEGTSVTTSSFDCKDDGGTSFGDCSFTYAAGRPATTFSVLVQRFAGGGAYQLTASAWARATPPPAGIKSETAQLTSTSGYSTVTLTETYTSPVVVCSIAYANNALPAVPRVRNAGSGSFEVAAEKADGTSAFVSGAKLQCLVVEAGTYTQAQHGVKMEAVRYSSTLTDRKRVWVGESRAYAQAYTNPVVVGQVMTANDPKFSVFWARGTTSTTQPVSTALSVGKHIAEDSTLTRAPETVGYLVFEAGSGSLGGVSYLAGVGPQTVEGVGNVPPYAYTISGPSTIGAVLLSSAGMSGTDGGWPVGWGLAPYSATRLDLAIDEDSVVDAESAHGVERVAYVVLGSSACTCADDGNPCTQDACSAQGVCQHNPVAQGTACTTDGNECTNDVCDAAGACIHTARNGSACMDDGNGCTSDLCNAQGSCQHAAMTGASCTDDGNGCTTDTCSAQGNCQHNPVSQGTACTDDGNACTQDVCNAAATCVHNALTGASCTDDGNGCTSDLCSAQGTCQHAALTGASCADDGNNCTSDTCSALGSCQHLPLTGNVCNDGNACTTNDACNASAVCAGINQCTGLAAEKVSLVSSAGFATVTLSRSYTSPVVVCSLEEVSTSAPMVPRVRNAAGSSFEVAAEKADGSNGLVAGVKVHCLIVEQGVYTLSGDGVKMEAVRYNSSVTGRKGSWVGDVRTLANSYTQPVVVGQVMSFNDPKWSVFWAYGPNATTPPTSTALAVGKNVAEDTVNTTRLAETVGYIVMEAGSGALGTLAYTAGLGANAIKGFTGTPPAAPPYSYAISGVLAPTAAIVSSAAMDGVDGGWPVLFGTTPISASTLALCIDEDAVGDAEREHGAAEQVAYVVLR